MRTTITSLGFVAVASANIIFNLASSTCNTNSTQMYHGCQRGQDCTDDGQYVNPSLRNSGTNIDRRCVALEDIKYPSSFGSLSKQVPHVQLRDVRPDGRCGKVSLAISTSYL
jgi:hypothetical protein